MKNNNKFLHEVASELDEDTPKTVKSSNFWLKKILTGIKEVLVQVAGLESEVEALLSVDLIEVEDTLPTASEDTKNKLYLVPNNDDNVDDEFDVYVTIEENNGYDWKRLDNVHIDVSGKLDISQASHKGKNVVVDSVTGDITFEDKPTIPSDVSDLTDTNNTQFTPKTHTHTESDIIDLGDYLEKSNTAGLVKNDGTIDTNQYLTQHQTLPDIVDNLTTDDATKVLSAKQGKKLNDDKVDKESGKGLFSGSYNDLTNTPTIPSKTSDLTNDSNFLTSSKIADNLTTNDNTKVLSAKQGKALNDKIGDITTFFNGSGN